MDKTFDIEIPYITNRNSKGRLLVFDRQLHGSEDHFVRFDLYPLISPSHMKRHYGWWDIPLKSIKQESTPFIFDFSRRTILLENRKGLLDIAQKILRAPFEFAQAWQGSLEETGYCKLHVSLWNRTKNPPQMLEVKSYPLVIIMDSMDLPFKQLNIPVTDRCNLKCTMCPRQNTDELVDADISHEILQPLLEISGDFSCVLLQGLGEPLLYKNICNIINQLKTEMPKYGEVGLTTNATLLNRDMAAKLLNSGLDFLYFSVDAASKSTYEAIRVEADFDIVVNNIIQCAKYREASGLSKTRLMMNFVIMQQNIKEIKAFAELSAKLGVEHVTYSYCFDAQSGNMAIVNKEELREIFDEAEQVADKYGINIYLPPLERAREEKCFFMERAVLLTQGDVVPCHAMAPGYGTEERSKKFGNVRYKAFKDIWNQDEYREFRYRVLSGDFPDECTGCECKSYLVP